MDAFFNDLRTKVLAVKNTFEADMRSYGHKAEACMKKHNVTVNDYPYKGSGWAGWLVKLKNPKANYKPGQRTKDALSKVGDDKPVKKGGKKEAEAAYENGLKDILADACIYYPEHSKPYLTAVEVSRTFFTTGILLDLAELLREYREENNAFLISDTALFLNNIIAGDDTPFLYEKTGNTYRHFFLDEFQDTSQGQWKNLRPLIENSLAEGHLNLIVGDVKQSIYRWRSGDYNLLLNGVESDLRSFKHEITLKQLDTNYRSLQQVLNFNNSLFRRAPELLQLLLLAHNESQAMQRVVSDLGKAYRDAYQCLPEGGKEGGFVQVKFYETGSAASTASVADEADNTDSAGNSENQETDETAELPIGPAQIPLLVEQLLDTGYKLSDIAFLVRYAKHGTQIAETMLAYKNSVSDEQRAKYGYHIISSESLYLCRSRPVRLLINLLRYLRNTTDRIALTDLVQEYQRYLKNNDAFLWHGLIGISNPANDSVLLKEPLLPADFITERPSLNKMPLYELTESLVRIFELNKHSDDQIYLQAYLDQVLEYTRSEKGDLESYLNWWQQTGSNKTVQVPQGQNAMQLLTIHKSKGLQFKVVIIPDCTWEIGVKQHLDTMLWAGTQHADEPVNRLPQLPIRYSKSLLETAFSEAYCTETGQAYMDNLNLLYVAATRAEEALYMFAPLPKPDSKGGLPIKNVGHLLYNLCSNPLSITAGNENPSLTDLSEYWNDAEKTFTLGSLNPQNNTASQDGNKTRIFELAPFRAERWRSRLNIRLSNRDVFADIDPDQDGETELSERLAATITPKIRGEKIHKILESLGSPAEIPDTLELALQNGEISPELKSELQTELDRLFSDTRMQQWFGSGYDFVKTERNILSPGGETHRPDRVLIKGNTALVLDFKTGRKHKNHHEQLRGYMQLLSQMGYADVSGKLVYLEKTEVEEVPIA